MLVTCLILCAMVWLWRPLPAVIWQLDSVGAWAARAVSALGWGTVLLSTFLIDHFELFGLRQTVLHALGRDDESPRFVERWLYRIVRQPLMLGFLLAFWGTPLMTLAYLVFAVLCTLDILVGVRMEERDLRAAHGKVYTDYERRVRGLLPSPRRAS